MAVRVIFKLKEPQAKIPPAAQKETPVNPFFNYGHFVLTTEGKKKYTPLKYATGEKIKPYYWKDNRFTGQNSPGTSIMRISIFTWTMLKELQRKSIGSKGIKVIFRLRTSSGIFFLMNLKEN